MSTLFICSTQYFVACQTFSHDQLESLQHILDDAIENIVNLSPRRIGIRMPAEDDIVLCLVTYLSARHIKFVTFKYENS